jgi:hypothetical protein
MPILLASSHLMLVADRVPEFNTSPSCRAAATVSVTVNRTESGCNEQERLARTQLEKEWAKYTPEQKTHCVLLTTLGGPPSYIELTTCLEMSKDASNLPPEPDSMKSGSGR